jgi:RNA polymerase sigma-70 factor (ECF subfamily)
MPGESHFAVGVMADETIVGAYPVGADVRGKEVEARLRPMIERHFDGLWTFCHRLGLADGDIDDAMQEIIFITSERLANIGVESERSFLFATAFRVASELRRKRTSRHEVSEEVLVDRADPTPGPEVLLDRVRARALLDRILAGMPIEQRAVFVLYEIEERSMAEISELLALPMGTVASRLRRARAFFDAGLARARLRIERTGGQR